MAVALSTIRSDESVRISNDLYRSAPFLSKLVGAVGLAGNKRLAESFTQESFLVRAIEECKDQWLIDPSRPKCTGGDSATAELAVLAMGLTRNRTAVPFLVKVFDGDYPRIQDAACKAFLRIGDPASIPVLEKALRNRAFYPVGAAFEALIGLGDRSAIPLAIARIDQSPDNLNWVELRDKLESVTGKKFAHDRLRWEEWWKSEKGSWAPRPSFFVKILIWNKGISLPKRQPGPQFSTFPEMSRDFPVPFWRIRRTFLATPKILSYNRKSPVPSRRKR